MREYSIFSPTNLNLRAAELVMKFVLEAVSQSEMTAMLFPVSEVIGTLEHSNRQLWVFLVNSLDLSEESVGSRLTIGGEEEPLWLEEATFAKQ